MKIDVSYTRTTDTFSFLNRGDTFEYGNIYWMKTEYIDDIDDRGTFFNAVDLEDGRMVHFSEDDIVTPINLKVVLNKED